MSADLLGLECADCGAIVFTIAQAAEHENELSTEDDPHGGWDTVLVPVEPPGGEPDRVEQKGTTVIKAEAVLLGAYLPDTETGKPVYTVENVRIDKGVRFEYNLDGEHRTEKGAVSLLVRYVADGGTDVRRFSLGQDVPLVNPDGSTEPLV